MSIPFSYDGFTGGLNSKSGGFLIDDAKGQARDLLNVQSTQNGAIVKRNGLATFSTPTATLTGLFACEETPTPFLIGSSADKLFATTAAGTTSTIKTGLSNHKWEFTEAPVAGGQGPLFGMNGTNTPQQWDGVAASTSDWTGSGGTVPQPVPNGTMVVQHANRAWVAGVAAHPSRVYFSSLSTGTVDLTNWSQTAPDDAGAVDLDPGDGESITGIGSLGPYLLVGKRHKLFIIYDGNTGANRRISTSVGIASHRSMAAGDDWVYFLSDDRGVYRTNGSQIQFLSDIMQPTVDFITAGQRAQACSAFYRGHYYLSCALNGATTNNRTFDFDTVLSSWWVHSISASQFAVWAATEEPQLYASKSAAAGIDHCFAPDVWVDNGTPFTWVWRGPWQSPSFYRRRRFPTPYFRKRWRQIRVLGIGDVDLDIADNFDTDSEAAVGVLLGGGDPTFWKVDIYGQGVALAKSLVFSGTSSTPAQVLLYSMLISDRRDQMVG